MSYTVTVAYSYRPGCASCAAEAEALAVQAVRDKQVTSITLRTVPKCDHADGSASKPPTSAPLPGQTSLPGLDALLHGGANGFDSDGLGG